MTAIDPLLAQMDADGFVVLPGVYSAAQVDSMLAGLAGIFHDQPEAVAIRSSAGSVYAARNVLALWPETADVWRQPPLPEFLARLLGPEFGLVRALFFDKPPGRSWTLPWHRDLTIAVRDNTLPSRLFSKPTRKAGVPHVEAPRAILEQMATVRIHLDDVTEENGPLKVQPGSHRPEGDAAPGSAAGQSILARRGDVLVMRPLLVHSSGHAQADTPRHRRIAHLEFAASPILPDGYQWHDFQPGTAIWSMWP
jgi:Phytanoyl-CoA dioxygenase (PhyH)